MKEFKVHNKSSKPDNIVTEENKLIERCNEIQDNLPSFMRDYFIYIKNSISLSSRLAYLTDIAFFCKYLVSHNDISNAEDTKAITKEEFNNITARDVNRFIGDFCTRYMIETSKTKVIMENHNRALARKRSTLVSLFKFLYRDEVLKANITDAFNPIKLPKPQPDAIKRLEVNEVAVMLDAVESGLGLTKKELQYWEKTKLRDKAILILFTTYGLRLNELQQLNISSFNFSRGEFKIYRKRGKEVNMPLNKSVEKAVKTYLNEERTMDGVSDEHEDAIFLSLQKKRMTKLSIRKLVKKYTSIALETNRDNGYSPHKLRATAASSLIQYGFSIYDVQNLLDHDNVTTTQLYAAHKKNVKREIVKNFEWLEEEE